MPPVCLEPSTRTRRPERASTAAAGLGMILAGRDSQVKGVIASLCPKPGGAGAAGYQHAKGPLAHPPEPAYPCCLPALGRFTGVAPHEGSAASVVGSSTGLPPRFAIALPNAPDPRRPLASPDGFRTTRVPRPHEEFVPDGA